jgi:phospholipid transport system substrate-binding protein
MRVSGRSCGREGDGVAAQRCRGRRETGALILALLLGVAAPARAATPGPVAGAESAAAFIAAAGRELGAIMQQTDADRRGRMEAFLARVVDIPSVGQFCMGRFWLSASPAHLEAYLGLLRGSLAMVLMQRAGGYGAGQTPVTVQSEPPTASGVRVPTIVADGTNAPAAVTWLVSGAAPNFRIVDVVAEGMSLRQTKRDEFTSFLAAHGGDVDAFLAALRASGR